MTRHIRFTLILAVAMIAAGCSPPTATPTPSPTATQAATATVLHPTATVGVLPEVGRATTAQGQIRIVQAAPESGAVDVYLEQGLIAGQLGLGAYTNPVHVESGTYFLQVVPSGARPSTQILASTNLNVIPDESFLVLITGTADSLIITIFQEDLSPVAGDQSRLAFIHAVPRGPAFTPQVDQQPLGDQIDYGQVSPGYLVEPAAHRLSFLGGEEALVDLNTSLAPRQMYTAVLIGNVGGSDYRALLFNTPIETPGQIRFIHADPESPAVNVYLDSERVASDIGFHQYSAWENRLPRTYQLRLEVAGSEPGSRSLLETRVAIDADQTLAVILLRDRSTPALRIFPTSLDPTLPNMIRLVVVNAAPDAPFVYASINGEQIEAITPVTYGMASNVIDFSAGLYNLLWATGQGENERVIEYIGETRLTEGYLYTYVVTGRADDPFLIADEIGIDMPETLAFAPDDESDDEDNIDLRVINVLADSSSVRVRLDDDVLLENLAPRSVSDVLTVRRDRYTVRIGPADGSLNTPDFFIGEVSIDSAAQASLILYGYADTMQVSISEDYHQATPTGQAVLRVINAVPGSGNLAIAIAVPGLLPDGDSVEVSEEGTPSFIPQTPEGMFETIESSAFGPGATSGHIGLPGGVYDIRVQQTSDSRVLLIVPHLALESRTLYDLVLLPGSGGNLEIQLFTEGEGL